MTSLQSLYAKVPASLPCAVVAGSLALAALRKWLKTRTPGNTVLELSLDGRKFVNAVNPQLRFLHKEELCVLELVDVLKYAETDSNVKGLILHLGQPLMGEALSALAQLETIRNALLKFRAAGKKVVAYSETIGEYRQAFMLYYLASAADRVYCGPLGLVTIATPYTAVPFVNSMLKKLGCEPQLESRREYKSMRDVIMNTSMTEAHREVIGEMMGDLVRTVVSAVAASRGLAEPDVQRALEEGPFLPAEALARKLIDGIAYRDEIYDRILLEVFGVAKEKASVRFLSWYQARKKSVLFASSLFATKVAYVNLNGNVMMGESERGIDGVTHSIGGSTTAAVLRSIGRQKNIKAIVVSVDTGGGSAVASEMIWRELQNLRRDGKKVVLLMGNLCASGGYYMACGADRIVAAKTTLTGSIGVVFGKVNVRRLLTEKLGIDFDMSVQLGNGGHKLSMLENYDERGLAWVNHLLDDIYAAFKQRVADARGFDGARTEELARGRVWTGAQAKERGLVDVIGGMDEALEQVRELLGLAPSAALTLQRFPDISLMGQLLASKPKNSNELTGVCSPAHTLLASSGTLFSFAHSLATVFNMVGLTTAVPALSASLETAQGPSLVASPEARI